MTDLKDFTKTQLEKFIEFLGKASYRASQIFRWLYDKKVEKVDEMTDLSKEFRKQLNEISYISKLSPEIFFTSQDGTKKFLFYLEDGLSIESVWIPGNDRNTLCISSQVGCRMGCTFCRTARMGFKRDLKTSEIINQVLAVLKEGFSVTNIVMMGMGEPLDNYDNVIKALEILQSQEGLNFSKRKITVSTSGIVPLIERLGSDNTDVNLSVSLNAATDEIRSKLMPVNKIYPLKTLLSVLKKFPLSARRKITLEYVLIKDINDSEKDALVLSKIADELKAKINIILLNEFEGITYKKPDDRRVKRFQEIILNNNLSVFLRESRGDDIYAACGQLAGMRP